MKKFLLSGLISVVVFPVWLQAQTYDLQQCKHLALQNNLRIKAEGMKIKSAEAVKKNAFTNYFPHVEAMAAGMKANQELLSAETPEMNLPVYNGDPRTLQSATQFAYIPSMGLEFLDQMTTASVLMSMPVYAGGRIVNGNKLAATAIDISRLQKDLTISKVEQETEQYFWTVISLQEKQKTIQSYELLLNNMHRDVNVAFANGLVAKSDLLKVDLELSKIQTQKLQLKNGLLMVKRTLCHHIGVSYSDQMIFSDSLDTQMKPEDLTVSPEQAVTRRKEYQMLEKVVDVEQLQKKISQGKHLPTVAVGAAAYYLDAVDLEAKRTLVFATVSVPISDWWGGYYKSQEHQQKIHVAKNNLQNNTELLKIQITKTTQDLKLAYDQIAVAQNALNQAAEHQKMMQDNHDAGIVSTSDLLEAQAVYQQTQDALVDAKTQYRICIAAHRQAIGAQSF